MLHSKRPFAFCVWRSGFLRFAFPRFCVFILLRFAFPRSAFSHRPGGVGRGSSGARGGPSLLAGRVTSLLRARLRACGLLGGSSATLGAAMVRWCSLAP